LPDQDSTDELDIERMLMAPEDTFDSRGIKLKELCERLQVNYDEARYVLARGRLPKAITPPEPGRGNHRLFNANQAFFLAVCLKLKAAGISADLAATVSEWSPRIQEFAQNGGWDNRFAPFAGLFETTHLWFLDVGDARYMRLVTDAHPDRTGLYDTPWTDMRRRKAAGQVRPAVIFRVDIALIAQQLQHSTIDAAYPPRRGG
jgi:hypothetical protein